MTHIRRPLGALLALFAGAIVLDRVGLDGSGETMSSWLYAVALAFALLPLALPSLRRARPWASVISAMVAYGVVAAVVGDPADAAVFVTTVEVAFLALVAALGHRVAVGIQEVDDMLGVVAFGESPAIELESQAATNEILAEMARSRRHGRPLSVTVVEPDPDSIELAAERAGEEVQRAIRMRYVRGELAKAMTDELRRTDLLFEHAESGRFVVVSPETEPDGAMLVAARVRDAAARVGILVDSGAASFPEQAITFEELVSRASDVLGVRPAPAPAPVRAAEGGGTS